LFKTRKTGEAFAEKFHMGGGQFKASIKDEGKAGELVEGGEAFKEGGEEVLGDEFTIGEVKGKIV